MQNNTAPIQNTEDPAQDHAAPPGPTLTPMMAQYMAVKARHPDALVFYRMGDFFELFFDDALTAAPILDIALTRRGKTDGTDIPMCGVPAHAYEQYLAKLIKAGFRVALCDQIETPEEAKAARGPKALVTRDVVRVVTPGTVTEDNLLDARAPNYLAAITQSRGQTAIAWLDLSTGLFMTESVTRDGLPATLARVAPREILVPTRLYNQPDASSTLKLYDRAVTVQPDSLFDDQNALRRLTDHYQANQVDQFGTFDVAEITAAGVLLDYVERTQKAAIMHIQPPTKVISDAFLAIDGATRRNLELTETLSGDRRGSVLHTIDRTVTAGGARLLQRFLTAPSRDLATIHQRHDWIEYFIAATALRDHIRAALKSAPDLERALARISLGRAAPRDLVAIHDGLASIADANYYLQQQGEVPNALGQLITSLRQSTDAQNLCDTLGAALANPVPPTKEDGGFIAPGFDPALDQQRDLRDNGRRLMIGLQQKYIADTGVDTLKIAHNNILGYYIEVTAKRADALFANPGIYIHRQTMATAVRFTSTDLAALERDLHQASSTALAIEMGIFKILCDQILVLRDELTRLSVALAHLDVATALADLAMTENYTRPTMTDGDHFDIHGARHVVVEQALKVQNQPFMANDADLSPHQRLWLLTGPNMAGKSTFLRQNALIILLAQMGSFVPANSARIGLVDRLFSRVGAADDLAKGQSTFMVEMVETAAILNQATPKSFVILDEIGRGTSTFDGLSIAWATLEYLHNVIACRGLFATHYHELMALKSSLTHLHLATMDVKEWQGDVIFLHQVKNGVALGSYGIHVARLAGLPAAVTVRADQIMHMLGNDKQKHTMETLSRDLPLFNATPPRTAADPKTQAIIDQIKSIDVDAMSPRDALEALYALKAQTKT